MIKNISAAILAGGESRRFGGIVKSNIVINGRPIVDSIVLTISELFDDIIIVTNTPAEFGRFSNCRFAEDLFRNAGPLGGIHAALKSAGNPSVFIFAGDMPFLQKHLIEEQIKTFKKSDCDILIPCAGEMTEPLHAVYRTSLLPVLESFLLSGGSRAARDFLSGVNTGEFHVPDPEAARRAFTNINSPNDITDPGSGM